MKWLTEIENGHRRWRLSNAGSHGAKSVPSVREFEFAFALALFAEELLVGRRDSFVDVYDGKTGRWSTARLSQARAGMVAATVGGQVLFAVGVTDYYGGTPSAVVDVFDAARGQWSVGPPLVEARQVRAAVTVGGTAMFAWRNRGGENVVDYYTVR